MTTGISKKQGTAILIIICIVVGSLAFILPRSTGMEDVRVAVYNDTGVLPSSATALLNMFQWMHAEVNYVNSTEIQQGVLNEYDIVVFPGGNPAYYSPDLGTIGRNAICQFIAGGGSYFGICGGSILGTNSYLRLFNGYASGGVNGSGVKIIEMAICRNSTGPDLSNEPLTRNVLYWNSGYFYSTNETYMSTVIPISTYLQNDRPGMIACKYGNGTVFLSFPHPEYEENSVRDGTDYFDYLDDSDSEWSLLMKVSLWLVNASR